MVIEYTVFLANKVDFGEKPIKIFVGFVFMRKITLLDNERFDGLDVRRRLVNLPFLLVFLCLRLIDVVDILLKNCP